MDKYDVAMLVLRVGLGLSMVAHGWNKVASPAGLDGTARWFGSIGMRWPALQARLASTTEIAAGLLMILGLLTSAAGAAFIALMTVAIVTVHWRVGYFIFLPNGGWEYCASIIVAASTVCIAGPGTASLDHALGLAQMHPVVAIVVGLFLPVCHLTLSYRPGRS